MKTGGLMSRGTMVLSGNMRNNKLVIENYCNQIKRGMYRKLKAIEKSNQAVTKTTPPPQK